LTGYIFAIYGHWSKYSFYGTWAAERNGNSISGDVVKNDAFENRRLIQQLSVFVLDLLILKDKYNIRTWSLNVKLIWTRCKTTRKAHQRLVFLPVSKAHANKLYIFRQCTDIVYVYLLDKNNNWWQDWIIKNGVKILTT
jgi:hypothetical protein